MREHISFLACFAMNVSRYLGARNQVADQVYEVGSITFVAELLLRLRFPFSTPLRRLIAA